MPVNSKNGGQFGDVVWSTDEVQQDDTICGSWKLEVELVLVIVVLILNVSVAL
jgi:hypothetical protein